MVSIYETINLVGYSIILIGTLIVGVVVLNRGLKRRMGNLIILGLLYLLTATSNAIRVTFSLEWSQFAFFQSALPILILEFTRKTFYRGRDHKRISIPFYLMTIIAYVITAVFAYLYSSSGFEDRMLYNIAASADIFAVVISNVYTVIAANEATRLLDPKKVEAYIIRRVKLWMYLSGIFAFGYALWITEIFIPGDATYTIINLIVVGFSVVHIIGTYHLWILPDWFKDYLNRDTKVEQHSDEDIPTEKLELNDTELEQIRSVDTLKTLGAFLSSYIGSSELAARGHLRFAAKIGLPNASINNFNYHQWNEVLGEPLQQQLQKLSLNVDVEQISTKMRSDLQKTQSIITMASN